MKDFLLFTLSIIAIITDVFFVALAIKNYFEIKSLKEDLEDCKTKLEKIL